MKKQTGFTLIELMIVVAIVAILAAIALPAYKTYTNKAKFSEVIAASGPVKSAVELCYQTNGDMTNCLSQGSYGIPAKPGASGYVQDVVLGGTSAAVTITASSQNIDTGNITYILTGTPSGGQITWENDKSSDANGGTCVGKGLC